MFLNEDIWSYIIIKLDTMSMLLLSKTNKIFKNYCYIYANTIKLECIKATKKYYININLKNYKNLNKIKVLDNNCSIYISKTYFININTLHIGNGIYFNNIEFFKNLLHLTIHEKLNTNYHYCRYDLSICKMLKTLELIDCNISYIPTLHNLEILKLQNIKPINGYILIDPLYNLKELVIIKGKINLTNILCKCKNIVSLYISHNDIPSKSMYYLNSLQNLTLINSYINNNLLYLTNLITISFTNNSINGQKIYDWDYDILTNNKSVIEKLVYLHNLEFLNIIDNDENICNDYNFYYYNIINKITKLKKINNIDKNKFIDNKHTLTPIIHI